MTFYFTGCINSPVSFICNVYTYVYGQCRVASAVTSLPKKRIRRNTGNGEENNSMQATGNSICRLGKYWPCGPGIAVAGKIWGIFQRLHGYITGYWTTVYINM
jgi:hypothetical protein